jgi:hypothetical protein
MKPELKTTKTDASRTAALVGSSDLLGVWECFSDPCYYDMWAVRRTHERGFGECFHMNSAEEAKGLTSLLNLAAKACEVGQVMADRIAGDADQTEGIARLFDEDPPEYAVQGRALVARWAGIASPNNKITNSDPTEP